MTDIAASASPRAGEEGGSTTLVTLSIMLATIMQVLDTTIANVALPHMQGGLSATQDQVSWVLTSYIVAAAIMTPPTGYLAARFGRRRLFLISVAGFTVASVLCGLAQSLSEMVIFRLLQGVFGAGLVPLSQATLLDNYPKEKHGQAMALWGMGVMVGPILGPTLGGWLTEYYDWRWVFFINLPLGLLAWLGIAASVKETERSARPFDFIGFALLSLAVGGLQLLLDRGQGEDWFASIEIIAESVIAGAALYLFVIHMFTAEALGKRPFLEPGLFADRNFVAGVVFIFIVGIILLATMALLPPYLQQLKGYPVMTTGLILAPRGVGSMVSMMLVGRLMRTTIDPRYLIVTGLLLVAISLWEMSLFTVGVSVEALVWTGVLQGLGLGLVFVPLSAVSFATLHGTQRVEGTALFSLMRNLGSSIGISAMVTLLAINTQTGHAYLAEAVGPYAPAVRAGTLPGAWDIGSTAGLMALNSQVTAQAAEIAYYADFRIMAAVTLAALPLVLLFRRRA